MLQKNSVGHWKNKELPQRDLECISYSETLFNTRMTTVTRDNFVSLSECGLNTQIRQLCIQSHISSYSRWWDLDACLHTHPPATGLKSLPTYFSPGLNLHQQDVRNIVNRTTSAARRGLLAGREELPAVSQPRLYMSQQCELWYFLLSRDASSERKLTRRVAF